VENPQGSLLYEKEQGKSRENRTIPHFPVIVKKKSFLIFFLNNPT